MVVQHTDVVYAFEPVFVVGRLVTREPYKTEQGRDDRLSRTVGTFVCDWRIVETFRPVGRAKSGSYVVVV